MSGLYYSFLNRCTFLFIAAAVLTMAAPFFIRRRQGLQTGICCFVVGWHLAIVDFAFEAMWWEAMMGPVFHAEDAQYTLINALLSLVIPLLSLSVILATGTRSKNGLSRGNRLLFASCSIALVDTIFLIYVISDAAMSMDGWISPGYRETLQQRLEPE